MMTVVLLALAWAAPYPGPGIPEAPAPETYRVAVVSAPRLDSREKADALLAALEAAAGTARVVHAGQTDAFEVSVAAAIVLGPLTANGTPGEYALCRDLQARSPVPLVFCPCPDDKPAEHGGLGRVAPIEPQGRDFFLFVDQRDPLALSDGALAGELQGARRTIAPARWSIGAAAALGPGLPMRIQTILFADTPLHAFIYGAPEESSLEEEESSGDADEVEDESVVAELPAFPWGKTVPIAVPPWHETREAVLVDVTPYAVGVGILQDAPEPLAGGEGSP